MLKCTRLNYGIVLDKTHLSMRWRVSDRFAKSLAKTTLFGHNKLYSNPKH